MIGKIGLEIPKGLEGLFDDLLKGDSQFVEMRDRAEATKRRISAVESLLSKMECTEEEILETISMMAKKLTRKKPVKKEDKLNLEKITDQITDDLTLIGNLAYSFEVDTAEEVASILGSGLAAVVHSGDKIVQEAIKLLETAQKEQEKLKETLKADKKEDKALNVDDIVNAVLDSLKK